MLDIDVHHGNGTQGIFYARADVLTVSIHADPTNYFPLFAGYAEETGAGAGEGSMDGSGRCSGRISPSVSTVEDSMQFSSSRTFPGHR